MHLLLICICNITYNYEIIKLIIINYKRSKYILLSHFVFQSIYLSFVSLFADYYDRYCCYCF